MSRWVQRDGLGVIIGDFANLQPGYAEEEVTDDSPELLAFRNPPISARESGLTADADRIDLLSRLQTATVAQLENYIDNNVVLTGTTVAQLRAEVQALLRVMFKRLVKVLVQLPIHH